jgi:hypothetical protein
MKRSTRWVLFVLVDLALIGGWFGLDAWRSRSQPPAVVKDTPPAVEPVAVAAVATPSIVTPAATPTASATAVSSPRRLVPCDPKQVVLPDPQATETSTGPSIAEQRVGSALYATINRTLASSSDPTTRAAALFLASIDNSIDPAGCVGNDCSEGDARRRQANAEAASALATLVQTANVPGAYAWALSACSSAQADAVAYPACGSLSLQRWAQAAPDNAWPWLTLANEARQRGDLSGLESAMHRASLARDWVHPAAEIRRLLVSGLPADATTSDFLGVIIRTVNFDAGKSPGLSTLSRYCDANQDANRRQTCTRLGDAALDSAKDLYQLSIAIKLGQRTGLAPERLERAATHKAQAEQALAATVGPPSEWTWDNAAVRHCRFINQQAQVALRTAEIGELAAARELLRPHKP